MSGELPGVDGGWYEMMTIFPTRMMFQGAWRTRCVSLCMMFLVVKSAGGDEPIPPDPKISAAIGNLESDDFETREEATRRLILTGKPAVAAVEQAVLEGELETQVRGITILEQMLFKGNMGAGIAALEALERLQSRKDRPELKHRADTVIADNREHVEQSILQHFESLGGKVQRQGVSRKNAIFANIDPLPTLTLLIGTDFKGTKTDLQRLRNVRVSQLLHRKSVEIDEETRKLLQEANPELQIHPRDVYLGIRFQPGPESFFLIEVVPNSAAAEGGLASGDEVVSFNSTKFDGKNFMPYIQSLNSGDKVVFQILRKGMPMEVVVTLREL